MAKDTEGWVMDIDETATLVMIFVLRYAPLLFAFC
jgi:hypothetical protein